ncbi:hypothetical protein [Pseudoalteromonas sp. ASV78]|uniref:hypothetical protein n=1 Tax=Pseudoalteromonas sp. ASV78 TaxID=3397851 RepID=UPI0039FCE4A1
MSLTNSFARGVAIEQSVRESHNRDRRYEEQSQKQDERFEAQNKRADESHSLSMARGGQGLAALNAEMSHRESMRPLELATEQTRQQAANVGLKNAELGLKEQKHNYKRKLESEDLTKRKQQAAYLYPMVMETLVSSGYDFGAVHEKYPEYFDLTKDMHNDFNFQYMMDPEQQQAIYKAADLLNPNTPSSLRDEGALDVINTVFADQIDRGEGVSRETGKPIANKRISQVYTVPGQPGKLALELDVTDSEGNTYKAPRTNNASTDDNDNIKLIDAKKAMGLLQAKQMAAQTVEKALQANPDAQKRIQAIYSSLNNKNKPLADGYMNYGNSTIKFDDAFKIYQNYLPDKQTNPDEHRRATLAMPWSTFKWAGGDEEKMQIARTAMQRNMLVYQKLEQRLSEAETGGEQERILNEMQQFIVDPVAEYNARQTAKIEGLSNNANGTETQSANGTETQSATLPSIPKREKMSIEDFALMDKGKDSKRNTSRPFSRRDAPHSYSINTRTLAERYQQYSKDIDEENKNLELQHQRDLREARQRKINQLTQTLEKGNLDDAGRAELRKLLEQQVAR